MRTISHAYAPAESHGIDLAPMLDFVVNLLIFFIITAVFVKQAGVPVNRPTRVDPGLETTGKSIVIDEHGTISIGSQSIDFRSVRAHVEQFRAADLASVVVVAHRHAPTGAVVAVVDQIRLGGIEDIMFTTTQ